MGIMCRQYLARFLRVVQSVGLSPTANIVAPLTWLIGHASSVLFLCGVPCPQVRLANARRTRGYIRGDRFAVYQRKTPTE